MVKKLFMIKLQCPSTSLHKCTFPKNVPNFPHSPSAALPQSASVADTDPKRSIFFEGSHLQLIAIMVCKFYYRVKHLKLLC